MTEYFRDRNDGIGTCDYCGASSFAVIESDGRKADGFGVGGVAAKPNGERT